MRSWGYRSRRATPPSWPRPENSLQVHLDFVVEDLDAAERKIVELGGRPLDTKDAAGPFAQRGYADPAGHSFSLLRVTPQAPKQG